MKAAPPFRLGMATLLDDHRHWIAGQRLGLISHMAALMPDGRTSAETLLTAGIGTLATLFGPEHGFIGDAGAGQAVRTRRHPHWKLPMISLYGEVRKPTPSMLKGLDALVFDMQTLPVRCYTYLATLRLAMEACAEAGLPLIVTDRPVPQATLVDGPLPDPAQASFVCPADVPLVFGLTPAEAALWLRHHLHLDLDLRIAPMQGYHRDAAPGRLWPPWYPPSPAIVSWQTALAYPATVAFEAFADLRLFRDTAMAFQIVGAPWFDAPRIRDAFDALQLPGLRLHPHLYHPAQSATGTGPGQGLRLTITDPARYRPFTATIALLHAIQTAHGHRRLWRAPQARPAFFDKLMGSAAIREALIAGEPPATILAAAAPRLQAFAAERRRHLLYPARPTPAASDRRRQPS